MSALAPVTCSPHLLSTTVLVLTTAIIESKFPSVQFSFPDDLVRTSHDFFTIIIFTFKPHSQLTSMTTIIIIFAENYSNMYISDPRQISHSDSITQFVLGRIMPCSKCYFVQKLFSCFIALSNQTVHKNLLFGTSLVCNVQQNTHPQVSGVDTVRMWHTWVMEQQVGAHSLVSGSR